MLHTGKLNLLIKDENKCIYSSRKGNNDFFASPHIKITLPSKICFKKIIISTKATVVGILRNHQTGDMDEKPRKYYVTLSSWNEKKHRRI